MSREEMMVIEEWLAEELEEYEDDIDLDEYRESYQDYISSYIY